MQYLKTSAIDLDAVVSAVRSCLPPDRKEFALHEPFFAGNEWKYVKDCIDTGWVSSAGAYVGKLEDSLRELTGAKHVSAVVNGTAALHLSLKLAGVCEGSEVIVPDLTFVATANAVAYCGATPHFADVSETTLGLDPVKLDRHLSESTQVRGGECYNRVTGRILKAVIVMHTFGHPADLDPLKEVCARWKLELIEDAAEALGSTYKGRSVGAWGKFSTLSFNGNKICTTGGGGAILTNDEPVGRAVRHLATTAKVPHPWAFFHDQIGHNYRMPNLNAALGLAQLERLPEFLARKRALAERYQKAFASVRGVRFFTEPADCRSNYWLNTILLDETCAGQRDALLGQLNQAGILARPVWTLMHKLPMFSACPRADVSVSEGVEGRILNLPSSAHL